MLNLTNPRKTMKPLQSLRLVSCAALCAFVAYALPSPASAPAQDPQNPLAELLANDGIELDLATGALSIPARVLITTELLEYLLVNNKGQSHESLLVTDATPSLVNAGILALGLEPGQNMRRERVAPNQVEPIQIETGDTPPEMRVVVPEGDGLLPYLAWKEGDELYFMRAEDALCDLAAERSMRRHRWVFLGSRFAEFGPNREEQFVADVEGNLINLAFFTEGSTLMTSALPECDNQTIWGANDWLLPPRGEAVRLILSREPLLTVPQAFLASLPEPVRERNGIQR